MKIGLKLLLAKTGIWVEVSSMIHRCGNVRIVCRGFWFIEVKIKSRWVPKMPKTRPWGYAKPGSAKRGVALMAAWEKANA